MKNLMITRWGIMLSISLIFAFSSCDFVNSSQDSDILTEDALSAIAENKNLTDFTSKDSNSRKYWDSFSAEEFVCDEVVDFEGLYHLVVNEVISSNGNFTYKFHINAKGSGIGQDSGATYQWNDSINEVFSTAKGLTGTFNQSWLLVGQGGAPNLKLNATFHITFNANGEVTTVVDNFSSECK